MAIHPSIPAWEIPWTEGDRPCQQLVEASSTGCVYYIQISGDEGIDARFQHQGSLTWVNPTVMDHQQQK